MEGENKLTDNFIDQSIILKSISNIFLFIQLQLCLTYLPQINFIHHGSSLSVSSSQYTDLSALVPYLWTVAKWLLSSTTNNVFFFFWYWLPFSLIHTHPPQPCNLCLLIPYSPLEITSFGKLLSYLGNYYILLKLPIYLLIFFSDCLLLEVKELIVVVRHYIPIT